VIPAQLQVAGQQITVRIVPPSKWPHGDDCEGVWWPAKRRIELLSTLKGQHREQRFLHELMHCVLDISGHEALSRDEGFVDRVAHLLHQALTSCDFGRATKR
jgi:hypothetical protein